MKEKTLIYPYDEQFCPILRNTYYPVDLEITRIVSPNGWGYRNKDAGATDSGPEMGLTISGSFEEALSDVDTVLFAQSDRPVDYQKSIRPCMTAAIENKKNIINTLNNPLCNHAELKAASDSNGKRYHAYCNGISDMEYEFLTLYHTNEYRNEQLRINSPVIFVYGLIEQVGKFDTQISLARYFTQKGYSPALISSRDYAHLGGAIPSPGFLFEGNVPEHVKILMFNHYLKYIENFIKPDVMIVGVPGGILPFNARSHNRFGVTAYEISRAVSPDASILCIYQDDFDDNYFSQMSTMCHYRFSSPIDAFIIHNTAIDFSEIALDESISRLSIQTGESNPIHREVDGMQVCSRVNRDKVFDHILSKLSGYAESSAF